MTDTRSAIPAGFPGFLLAQCEVIVHDIEWFGRNFACGNPSCGLLLEFHFVKIQFWTLRSNRIFGNRRTSPQSAE
jgi:hypothetical protein